MVFMKTSHGIYKCHVCGFLECKEGWLELVMEVVFPTTQVYADYNFFQSSIAFHKTIN